MFNRLTSVGTELRWRMDQREEEEPGMTTEEKNEVGEGEAGRNTWRRAFASR